MLSLIESLFHLQIYDRARPFSLSRNLVEIVDLTLLSTNMLCSISRCDRQYTLFLFLRRDRQTDRLALKSLAN
jgi:ABC-type protease/lipase transport system fused ATPase/permease subunit